MAWIHVTPELEAEGDLRSLYEELYAQFSHEARGSLDNILQIHSLDPDGLRAHLALYRSAMTSTPTLPRVDREMIAVVVSTLNACHY